MNTMTKPYKQPTLFLTTLFFLSLIHTAQSGKSSHFEIQGRVYCDPCRVEFVTKATTFLKGATVRLECRNRETDSTLTFKGEATTDGTGTYHISADGDYEDDVCEVKLVKSPDPDCSEISENKISKDAARVSLATNSGMASNVRMVNPLGFMKKEALSECKEMLSDMGISDPETL